jgi:hypothetical protein
MLPGCSSFRFMDVMSGAPTNLQAVIDGLPGGLTISWTAGDGNLSYRYVITQTIQGVSSIFESAATQFTTILRTNIVTGATYTFTVTGYSVFSPAGDGTPLGTATLATPVSYYNPFGGPQGVQGYQGIQGIQGWTGPTGIQGVQGIQGPAFGATGPTGPTYIGGTLLTQPITGDIIIGPTAVGGVPGGPVTDINFSGNINNTIDTSTNSIGGVRFGPNGGIVTPLQATGSIGGVRFGPIGLIDTDGTINGVTIDSGGSFGFGSINTTGLITAGGGFTGPALNTINGVGINPVTARVSSAGGFTGPALNTINGVGIDLTTARVSSAGGFTGPALNTINGVGIDLTTARVSSAGGFTGPALNTINGVGINPTTSLVSSVGGFTGPALNTINGVGINPTTARVSSVGGFTGPALNTINGVGINPTTNLVSSVGGFTGPITGSTINGITISNGNVSCTTFSNSTSSTFTGNVSGNAATATSAAGLANGTSAATVSQPTGGGDANALTVAAGKGTGFSISAGTISCGAITASSVNVSNGYSVNNAALPFTVGSNFLITGGQTASYTSALSTSPDGVNWISRTPTSITSNVAAAAWNGALWVIGGETTGGAGALATSSDGITWTTRTPTGITEVVRTIAWNGSLWVIGGTGTGAGALATSSDGITWTSRTPTGITAVVSCAAWNGSLWVIGGQTTAVTGALSTSPDGITWTSRTPTGFSANSHVKCVAWNGSLWVIGGISGGAAALSTSTDGITWTSRIIVGVTQSVNGISWNGSYWLAVGVGAGTGVVAISTDGITWTSVASQIIAGLEFGIVCSCWDGYQWIVGGSSGADVGAIARSSNGINWTSLSPTGLTLEVNCIASRIVLPFVGTTPVFNRNISGVTLTTTGAITAPTTNTINSLGISNGTCTGVDFVATSDRRLKSDISTISNALETVKGLRGVYFTRLGETKRSVGVIAQEVEEILPEVVHGDDMKSVSYGNIVGLLIEAVKELSEKMER